MSSQLVAEMLKAVGLRDRQKKLVRVASRFKGENGKRLIMDASLS